MKAFLLYKDKDFNWDEKEDVHQKTLIQDMQLEVIFNKMAAGNKDIYDVVKKVMLKPLFDKEEIVYRQKIFKDCIRNRWIFEEIEKMRKSLEEKQKESGRAGLLWDHPESKVSIGIEVLTTYMDELKMLQKIANTKAGSFKSYGFSALFERIRAELDDKFFKDVKVQLEKCQFRDGIEIGMNVAEGLKSSEHKLVEPEPVVKGFMKRLFSKDKGITFKLDSPDDKDSITELREKGLNSIGNTLMQAADHIRNFFIMFERELNYYLGCLNLCEYLQGLGMNLVYPNIVENEVGIVDYSELCDTALAVQKQSIVTGNDGNLYNKKAVIISGANQGGKTTFLRSIGQAIIFTQCGMFVTASAFTTGLYNGIYTHFRKEEDTSMKSGKLDEELMRIDKIIRVVKPGCLIMFNESFASTNEREGTDIGLQILKALEDRGIRIFLVTHFYELAESFRKQDPYAMFLRAERRDDGVRTFKILEGYASKTGFGMDLYEQIFTSEG